MKALVSPVPEAELQRWFEHAARKKELHAAISNLAELAYRIGTLERAPRHVDRPTLDGLRRAKLVCDTVIECELLVADKSVAPADSCQLRPDLVLFSDSAHFILVELKTRQAAERQAVQELLAYSMAVKMQAPYLNDTLFVVVAQAWTDSLRLGVRALILEGKHVLALAWTRVASGQFQLRIMMELYQFDFVQPYDPYYAMTPCTLAVARASGPEVGLDDVKYLKYLSRQLLSDANRLQQSGFVLIHVAPCGIAEEILGMTLVTVNQHWLMSDDRPDKPLDLPAPPGSLCRAIDSKAQRDRMASVSGGYDDHMAQALGNEEAARSYPQSTLSYNLIERHRDPVREARLEAAKQYRGKFECGCPLNLAHFLNNMPRTTTLIPVNGFLAFGELADTVSVHGVPQDLTGLQYLLAWFRDSKRARFI